MGISPVNHSARHLAPHSVANFSWVFRPVCPTTPSLRSIPLFSWAFPRSNREWYLMLLLRKAGSTLRLFVWRQHSIPNFSWAFRPRALQLLRVALTLSSQNFSRVYRPSTVWLSSVHPQLRFSSDVDEGSSFAGMGAVHSPGDHPRGNRLLQFIHRG